MILTHIDLKYVSLIYRKIHQKVPNGKGLRVRSGDIYFSLGEVLTLNVKYGEDVNRNSTVKKYPGTCTKFALFGPIKS